ncbi:MULTISPECIES: hypothetical protein [unclassified Pseudactinotalea]|uniref:hypothetical protein n=1 Tax=unclassified Pseudactinotalea TaxID=2649176 RepID=UPI00128BD521|nr:MULTISPECIES: hypothetical protein [unclassified Pseudactinotalea]MPV48687.1 hypothetical protein [Pseudactinotalea sp. HY160]QGH68655.1 hypothetical protein GCE65_03420 [Pseudactinotalea sp. HY158]
MDSEPYLSRRRVVQLVAAGAAVVGAVAACLLPLYATSSTSSTGTEVTESVSAWHAMGPSILVTVAFPVAFALLPLFSRGRWWQRLGFISAALLILFTLAGLLSIGMLFIPATALAAAAMFVRAPETEHTDDAVTAGRG